MSLPGEFISAIELAQEAGSIIMDVYESHNLEVTYKADDSPLTRADMLSHHFLVSGLEKLGYPVISEEGDPELYNKRLDWPRYWLVDPLDGTKEFVKRNGEFTVNIALIENNKPVWGIIYAPVLLSLYAGIVGKGAWIWEHTQLNCFKSTDFIQSGELLPLRSKNKSLIIIGSISYLSDSTKKFIKGLERLKSKIEFISAGSSLKFCRIATGDADIYPRMDSIMEWDIAAGQAIVLAAGGIMVKWPEQTEIEFTSSDMRSPCFVAIAPGRDGFRLFKEL